MCVFFPGAYGHVPATEKALQILTARFFRRALSQLAVQFTHAFKYQCSEETCRKCHDCKRKAEQAVAAFKKTIPEIQKILHRDMQAAYEGDPAARSTMEVVVSYPCVFAIVAQRIAHEFYELHVPLVPRMMTECAHSRTGIDIHPGAKIGAGFFIDHGTGVVIGETCVIGENVKLYQGVTLGALSFEKDEHGLPVKGVKRHPNVEDHVVIYAGATVLGGNTTIGHHAQIGGNVWLTHSVPPYAKVYNQQPSPLIK
jgi:serine O-acetyltransferase